MKAHTTHLLKCMVQQHGRFLNIRYQFIIANVFSAFFFFLLLQKMEKEINCKYIRTLNPIHHEHTLLYVKQ